MRIGNSFHSTKKTWQSILKQYFKKANEDNSYLFDDTADIALYSTELKLKLLSDCFMKPTIKNNHINQ